MPKHGFIERQKQIDRFCRQYLQLGPKLDYPHGEHLKNDSVQQAIFEALFAENVLKHPPPTSYQLRVLKELISKIEHSVQDWESNGISDDLMNCLSSLLSSSVLSDIASAQRKAYVTFTLASLAEEKVEEVSSTPIITLLESHTVIAAGGTTGLKTWEAALHLGTYLCDHPHLISGQSILELGAGTGYLSILCTRYLAASHVLSTDGSSDVVTALSTNIYLNSLQESTSIEAKELLWGHALVGSEHSEWNLGRKIDLVLGADVTYDTSIIPALVATFTDLFAMYPDLKVLIAATIRNEHTFENFIEVCSKRGFAIEEIQWPTLPEQQQMGPFYKSQTPIKIVMVTK